jgi:hypothetical protein
MILDSILCNDQIRNANSVDAFLEAFMLIFNYLIPYYIQLKFVHRVQQTDQFALILDY